MRNAVKSTRGRTTAEADRTPAESLSELPHLLALAALGVWGVVLILNGTMAGFGLVILGFGAIALYVWFVQKRAKKEQEAALRRADRAERRGARRT